MILDHFVNNSFAHPHPERKLKVVVVQASDGICVVDNGSGVSLERLHAIESRVRAGETVQTDHESGTGSGLRDSILLLKDLLVKDGVTARDARGRQAMITIASKEGAGTIASITWFHHADESKVEIGPDGWNYIQFSIDTEEENTVKHADSGSLPRPVSDMIATHDSLLAGTKASA